MNVEVASFSSLGTAFRVPLVCARRFRYIFSEVPFSLSCGALFDAFLPVNCVNYFVHFASLLSLALFFLFTRVFFS